MKREEIKAIFDYSVGYMQYLDDGKTEREATEATLLTKRTACKSVEIKKKLVGMMNGYFPSSVVVL